MRFITLVFIYKKLTLLVSFNYYLDLIFKMHFDSTPIHLMFNNMIIDQLSIKLLS